jgi:small conductance mechanosensitive channel
MNQAMIETLTTYGTTYGLKLLGAIAIFWGGKWAARWVLEIVRKIMLQSKIDPTLVSFANNVLYALALTFIGIAAINQLGISTSSIIAIIGAAGLAVGLAFQNSLSNLAAGIMIILFKPFRIGDYIEGAGVAGVAEELSIFFSSLRTPDNKLVVVPNSKLINENLVNFSAKEIRRVDMVFACGHHNHLPKVKQILEEVVKAEPLVLKDPAAQVVVLELTETAVKFAVRPWVKTAEYWNLFHAITEAVKIRFDEAGVEMPSAQVMSLPAPAAPSKPVRSKKVA